MSARRVDLVDGRGAVASAAVVRVDQDEVECAVQTLHREVGTAPTLVVVQALPKGDRGELAVEMLTEVGVDVVVPWAATRCVAQWHGERGARALGGGVPQHARRPSSPGAPGCQRWDRPATTDDVAGRLAASTLGVVLDEGGERRVTDLPVPSEGDIVVVVGPEGGITGRGADDVLGGRRVSVPTRSDRAADVHRGRGGRRHPAGGLTPLVNRPPPPAPPYRRGS